MQRMLILTTAMCLALGSSALAQSARNSLPVIGPTLQDQSVRQTQQGMGAATDLATRKPGDKAEKTGGEAGAHPNPAKASEGRDKK